MFHKIANNFFPIIDTTVLDSFPSVHVLKRPDVIKEPMWITHYPKYKDKKSEIAFTTPIYSLFPQFCKDVSAKILELSSGEINIPVRGIHILRTIGDVAPHIDPFRKSAINIGITDSSAVTKFSINHDFSDFETTPTNTNNFVCGRGDIYLLDVTVAHTVCQNDNIPRYLVTLPFSKSYTELLQIFRP